MNVTATKNALLRHFAYGDPEMFKPADRVSVHCAVCEKHVMFVARRPDLTTYVVRCHGSIDIFALPDEATSVTVFQSEALRRKQAQARKNHAAKRRSFLSAKRNGWRGEGEKR